MLPVACIYLPWIWSLFWKFYAIFVSKITAGEKSDTFLESLIPPSSCQCRQCSQRGCPWNPALLLALPWRRLWWGSGDVCVSHLSFKLKETGYRDWISISCCMKLYCKESVDTEIWKYSLEFMSSFNAFCNQLPYSVFCLPDSCCCHWLAGRDHSIANLHLQSIERFGFQLSD